MGARTRRFTSLASGSGKATAVVVCAVMLLSGCGGSGGSAYDASTPVIRGDVATTSALTVSGDTTTAAVGTPIALTSVGGTGTDPVKYETASAGCKVTDSSLTATAAGTCVVTATQGAQTGTASFTFTAASSSLTVTGTPATAAVGTTIALKSAGGTGTGTVTYATTTDGCAVNASSLTATAAGTCVVTATQGAQTGTASFTFTAASSSLTITGDNLGYKMVGTPIALTSSGGTGNDPVTYKTNRTGCEVSDKVFGRSGTFLTATTSGTCVVTATQGTQIATFSVSFVPNTEPSRGPDFYVSGSPLDGTAGEPIALFLVVNDLNGKPGLVVFTTTTDGCTVTDSSLTRSSPGDCTVYATKGDRLSEEVTKFTFRAPGSEVVVPTENKLLFTPPTGCTSWWKARLSPRGEPRPSMETTNTIAQDWDSLDSPYFCGDYWIPGGFADTGFGLYNKHRNLEFSGWNTEKDGSGVAYTPGVLTRIPDGRPKGFTVYAQFRTCCMVSFEAGEGSGSMSPMTGSVSSTVTLPKVSFTRPGYAAFEWVETKASVNMRCVYNKHGDCGSGIYPLLAGTSSEITLDRSYVLQPLWEPAWTVTFDGNGGTLGAAKQMPPQVFPDKLARRLDQNQFSRSSYQFTGWNTKTDGTGTAYSQRQVMTPPADITLYAQWSCTNCYTVSFDANGGSGTQPSPLTSAAGSSVTAPAGSGYTRPGQQFAGWNTAANGTGTAYAAGTSFIPTANMTLYARWVAAPSPTVTTQAATVPGAPALTALSRRSKTEAWVTFSAPTSDGGKPITGYTVTVKGPNGGSLTQSFLAQAGRVSVGPLNNKGFYTFTVRAVNSVGTSNPSNATRYLNLG